MSDQNNLEAFGRTIQVFLVEGTPIGLRVASIYGWTGSVLVSRQASFAKLLGRPKSDRTGIYILYGPETEIEQYEIRAYIGEAEIVRERIRQSADERGFWETALVITTSDDALTKGHIRYLEARLIELAKQADRVKLDNAQMPDSDRRKLPEADKANMEAFIANVAVILPILGLDLFKPKSKQPARTAEAIAFVPKFEIKKGGVHAIAEERDGVFIVLSGSEAVKDSGMVNRTYAPLKSRLITGGLLTEEPGESLYKFASDYSFTSVSAAAAVVLDRVANGRTEWKVFNSPISYAAWQEMQEQAV